MWLNVWYIQVESKYKEIRHATLEIGVENRRKRPGGGGGASWTAEALFAWTRTHDEPGKLGTLSYIAAGLLCADVSFAHRACAVLDVGAKASHGNNRLLDACFRVFVRCEKKKIFNSFTSFSYWKWFISDKVWEPGTSEYAVDWTSLWSFERKINLNRCEGDWNLWYAKGTSSMILPITNNTWQTFCRIN